MQHKHHPLRKAKRFAIIALLALPSISSCAKGSAGIVPPEAAPLAVRTALPTTGDMQKNINYIGSIHSTRENTVLARLSGTLLSLPRKESEAIARGDIIATLSTESLTQKGRGLWATLQSAKLEAEYLCAQSKIDLSLAQKAILPRERADLSSHRCKVGTKSVNGIQASLAEFYATKRQAIERAPFRGKILRWLARPGENVFPGKPLLLIGNSALEVRVNVNERDLPRGIHTGSSVALRFSNITTPHRAVVSAVMPIASGVTRTVEVRIGLSPALSRLLRHGTSVDVHFIIKEERGVPIVPRRAITADGSKSYIFVVKHNSAAKVEVVPSIFSGDRVSIPALSLAPDTRVITSNLDMVTHGMALYPVHDEEQTLPRPEQAPQRQSDNTSGSGATNEHHTKTH